MILDTLALQFTDNIKARVINKDQSNPYRKRGNKRKVRSQIAIHQYLGNYEKQRQLDLAKPQEPTQ
jgi:polyphosphate kinase